MKRLAIFAAAAGALAAPALAHAAPPIARPNPAVYPVRLDYVNPLRNPDGTTAILPGLERAEIVAATVDKAYLAYHRVGDLGGFMPAPLGEFAVSSGGHAVLAEGTHRGQIPLFQTSAGGKVNSFTFAGSIPATPSPPDNGSQPLPGIGVPIPPPTPGPVPPANQGFGGAGTGTTTPGKTTTGPPGTTRPQTTTTTPGTTTTTTTTPILPPTTATTTTTSGGRGSGGSGGGGGSAGSCGVAGIDLSSDSPHGCIIGITNAAPGDAVSEVVTVTNTSGTPYTVSLQAVGAPDSHLWDASPSSDALDLAVWDISGPAPGVFPTLESWTHGYESLATLAAGQTAKFEVELFLPSSAGDADMGKTATIELDWLAQG